ncbi:MAG: hypothetical protein ACK40I_10555 [Tabrizicola sp.]
MLKPMTLVLATAVLAVPAIAQEASNGHEGHMMSGSMMEGDMGPAAMAFMEANARMHEGMVVSRKW